MEKEPICKKPEIQKRGIEKGRKFLDTSTDIETASVLIQHIESPCSDTEGNNVRNVYLREAAKQVKIMKNPFARELLEETIQKYSKEL